MAELAHSVENGTHVHDVSCSFGNPTCPAFGEEPRRPLRRPLRERVWFWKPEWYWYGWRTLIPFYRGGDEWDWHTICLGWTVTGRIIIATRRCPQTGRCAGEPLGPDWPADPYVTRPLPRGSDQGARNE